MIRLSNIRLGSVRPSQVGFGGVSLGQARLYQVVIDYVSCVRLGQVKTTFQGYFVRHKKQHFFVLVFTRRTDVVKPKYQFPLFCHNNELYQHSCHIDVCYSGGGWLIQFYRFFELKKIFKPRSKFFLSHLKIGGNTHLHKILSV